MIAAECRWS